MPDRKEALLDLEASIQADLDAYAEERSDVYRDTFANLLVGAENRDPEIFALFGVPVEVVLADYTDVPIPDRGVEWQASLSAMWGAAKWQAWVEVFGVDFLALAQEDGRKVQALADSMPRGDVQAAAVQGIGKDRIKRKKQERESKVEV